MDLDCDIGKLLKDKCHKDTFTNKKDLTLLSTLSDTDQRCLHYRIPVVLQKSHTIICSHHIAKYLTYYENKQKYCIDPFKRHRKRITLNLRNIDLDTCDKLTKSDAIRLIPGQKICNHCFQLIQSKITGYKKTFKFCCDPLQRHRTPVNDFLQAVDQNFCNIVFTDLSKDLLPDQLVCSACVNKIMNNASMKKDQSSNGVQVDKGSTDKFIENYSSALSTTDSIQDSNFQSSSQEKKNVNSMLAVFDLPPLKRQKFNKITFTNKAIGAIETIISKASSEINKVYDINIPDFSNCNQLYKDSLSLHEISRNLVLAYNSESKISEKVRLLTLLPSSWTYNIVYNLFKCSRYIFNEAQKLRNNAGIFAERKRKTYFRIPESVKQEIIDYYLDDRNSRFCSGMKECVMQKVKGDKSIALQKRYLLYDLKDLYNNWRKETANEIHPCFALFATLRPIQCVPVGSPGTHTICVCESHQNVKLKLSVLNTAINYKNVLCKGVCSIENEGCMFGTCNSCPGSDNVLQFLNEISNRDPTQNIRYKNWTTVTVSNKERSNKTYLADFEEPYDEFLKKLITDLCKLKTHHFISEKQKISLHQSKENLDFSTCIILLDFAENYSFLCQDSTQGYYYNNMQATLHPFVVYHKDRCDNQIKVISFCVISDCTKHTAGVIHIFLEQVLNELKEHHSEIENIIYFSDGAPTQYKNKNHFVNLCYHKEDFGLTVKSHNFFATSHGKSACDGIGAVVKREVRRASLQRPFQNQIQTHKQMYEYCSENISGIRFSYVDENQVNKRNQRLAKRFSAARTVSNTRMYHYYEPIDKTSLKIKLYSSDTQYLVVKIK